MVLKNLAAEEGVAKKQRELHLLAAELITLLAVPIPKLYYLRNHLREVFLGFFISEIVVAALTFASLVQREKSSGAAKSECVQEKQS